METSHLKLVSLVTLIIQNTSLVLLLRASNTKDGVKYISSTAVVVQEMIKMVVCLVLVAKSEQYDIPKTIMTLKREVHGKWSETLRLAVPAVLYVFQNNVQHISSSMLDVGTYQVTYQLKILTTAVLFCIMMNKRLSPLQWLSLVILLAGVILVQIPENYEEAFEVKEGQNRVVGVSLIVLACISSGFASVYFEKILKGAPGASSIWVKNIQLGLFSLVIASFTVIVKDGQDVLEDGFFRGYDSLVCITLLVSSMGGLIIAVVVKYADNILKGFATSVAIIVSAIGSWYFFDSKLSPSFFMGALLVITAVFLYGREDSKAKQEQQRLQQFQQQRAPNL